MQTPIVVGDYLYACKANGVVTCYRAQTGQQHYSERLGPGGRSGFAASPVAHAVALPGSVRCPGGRGVTNGEEPIRTPSVARKPSLRRSRAPPVLG
jgi:hypothetical protein